MNRKVAATSGNATSVILCCGDALIDMLPRNLADGTAVFLPAAGGAIFNTAIALGRLGVPTAFLSGVSTDMFGRRLVSELARAGVDSSLCIRSDRPTTLAFVELVDGNARYTFYDERTAGRTIAVDDLPELPDAVDALHFGGLSLAHEPSATAYVTLLEREAPRRVISLDPNIRANAIADASAYRERIGRLIGLSDIVKLSDEDLDWIESGGDPVTAIDRWIAAGVSIVVVTRGARGASAYTARGEVSVDARAVTVVDTVGAGDGFDAGLLAGFRQQGLLSKAKLANADLRQITQALELATEVAARAVARHL